MQTLIYNKKERTAFLYEGINVDSFNLIRKVNDVHDMMEWNGSYTIYQKFGDYNSPVLKVPVAATNVFLEY
jgi:hypothetical protein